MQVTFGDAGASLQLSDTTAGARSSEGNLDYILATLKLPGVEAVTRVSLVHGVDVPLSALFDDLARNWRGWRGSKEWTAYEGGLELSCTHDGLGHVAVAVELHRNPADVGDWCVRGEVPLEAGQLDQLHRDVRRFELAGSPGQAP